jgi:hypothetical protein
MTPEKPGKANADETHPHRAGLPDLRSLGLHQAVSEATDISAYLYQAGYSLKNQAKKY